MSHAASDVPLFVPPVGRQYSALVQPLELRTGSCSTPGCPFDGHPLHGGKCSACGQGWSPERLEQLRSLAEAADADTRARAFVDWDEPGVTLAPGRYEKLRRAVERWASNNTSSSVAPSVALEFVAKLLLESRRLLTPEQARGIWRAVSPMVRDVDYMDRSKFVVFLASFLSSPERWCRIPFEMRHDFWDDEAGGCTWLACAPLDAGADRIAPTYNEHLREKLAKHDSKVAAASCLTRALPASVLQRLAPSPLPRLPRVAVGRIFRWLEPAILSRYQVTGCYWMVCGSFRKERRWDGQYEEWHDWCPRYRAPSE